jgi:hypothetical protein
MSQVKGQKRKKEFLFVFLELEFFTATGEIPVQTFAFFRFRISFFNGG